MISEIEKIFTDLGGNFLTKPVAISNKLSKIKGILFDWDGVFNTGVKGSGQSSTFSEIDSMGVNLLRFAIWLETKKVPFAGIITGQINDTAFELAKREHFNSVYYNFKSKNEALEHIKKDFKINPSNVVFIFDDVLDISAAKNSGLSMMIKRTSSPLLNKYVVENKLADYITGHVSKDNAIREICEMLIGMKGLYEEVIDKRIEFFEEYSLYLEQRNSISAKFFHKVDKKIIETII